MYGPNSGREDQPVFCKNELRRVYITMSDDRVEANPPQNWPRLPDFNFLRIPTKLSFRLAPSSGVSSISPMERIVFTNGCFDLLHPGHVDLLNRAKQLGTRLIVGINSDASVRRIKGSGRPFMNQADRAALLSALESVDEVVVFDDLTPEKLIREIAPDVLVKGGDWKPEEIIGSDFVLENGGEVRSLPLLEGYSSSDLVEKIQVPSNGSVPVTSGITQDSLNQHIETLRAVSRYRYG